MDSSISIKTFKYNSAQPPVFSVVETPFHYRSFPQTGTNIKDLSFSSYLKHEQSHDLSSHQEDSEINVFDAQKYFSESNDHPKERKAPNFSPSIKHNNFAAEPNNDVISRLSSVSSVDGYGKNFRVRSFHATPTASSEASWNSQTGLLSNPPGSIPVSLRNISSDHHGKRRGNNNNNSSSSKWFFCRKCPCTGKSCVQVEEASSEVHFKEIPSLVVGSEKILSNMSKKSSPIAEVQLEERIHQKVTSSTSSPSSRQLPQSDQNNLFIPKKVLQQRVLASTRPRPFGDTTTTSAGGFSFPILNSSNGLRKISTSTTNICPLDDPPRESLEVFQPPDNSNLIKKSLEEDVASDASSDLFEIESFSTQTTSSNYPMHGRRDSLEDASTLNARRLLGANNNNNIHGIDSIYGRRSSLDEPMTPRTECYAPSEASIDWSVTTAEGFDKASMTNFSISASEYDQEFTVLRHGSMMDQKRISIEAYQSTGFYSNEGGGRKKMGNGLLSCRHEKAVSVGPNPVKWVQEGPPLPLISTSGHVSSSASRPPKANAAAPSARAHHSARLSLAFAA